MEGKDIYCASGENRLSIIAQVSMILSPISFPSAAWMDGLFVTDRMREGLGLDFV